ncbi:MAG: glycoside hydrolase family 130 protein [Bacteroidetes bacterium]|nr:glycoside hydrolase family 130 protein [Bacteroidota bacterium]
MFVSRLSKRFSPNPERVILQFLNPGSEQRIKNVIERVQSLSESEVSHLFEKITHDFSFRHLNFKHKLIENYNRIEKYLSQSKNYSKERKLLLGAYFSKEYSIEAASLFNPSIVPHPDQSNLKPGMVRFIMSLRATGEGHISSIEFRSGVVDENCEIFFDETSRYCELPTKNDEQIILKHDLSKRIKPKSSEEKVFLEKLHESFSSKQIIELLQNELVKPSNENINNFIKQIMEFVDANYEIQFSESTSVSERVIFPNSLKESVGMEDARFVKFLEDDGSYTYYSTYTAYNGRTFGTQLIETKDFLNFKIRTLHGSAVQDKGMAIFPRKINGKYVITSRQGGENLQIMFSDDLYNWDEYKLLKIPNEHWEFIQIGNCGSPIETNYGWLLITHAVGSFRRYTISAILLDLNDPSKVIGSLTSPLIEPLENEREGYVPNVVYSCGSMIHQDELIIPYAMSDSYCGFAKVSLSGLLAKLLEIKK